MGVHALKPKGYREFLAIRKCCIRVIKATANGVTPSLEVVRVGFVKANPGGGVHVVLPVNYQ
jgi:hypothetical protein